MKNIITNGQPVAVIVVPIVMEYDRDKNLIFEWRSLDHFQVTDATYENLEATQIDFCHINSIEFDADSNLIISSRHMDEITKIDKETGDIIWRFGGRNNEFTLEGDSMFFSHQHAVRRTNAGTFTMFDNGNYRQYTFIPFSRAVEYKLDETNKVATKIWEFRHTPDRYGAAMGYVQRLPDKGTLIGWGECDSLAVTELDSNDQTIFEMSLPWQYYSYRAYKYDANYIHSGSQVSQASVNLLSDRLLHISISPNPFTEIAKIDFTIPNDGYVELNVFDGLGREVSNVYTGFLNQGEHEYNINAENLSGGLYYLRTLLPGSTSSEVKVMIIK